MWYTEYLRLAFSNDFSRWCLVCSKKTQKTNKKDANENCTKVVSSNLLTFFAFFPCDFFFMTLMAVVSSTWSFSFSFLLLLLLTGVDWEDSDPSSVLYTHTHTPHTHTHTHFLVETEQSQLRYVHVRTVQYMYTCTCIYMYVHVARNKKIYKVVIIFQFLYHIKGKGSKVWTAWVCSNKYYVHVLTRHRGWHLIQSILESLPWRRREAWR